MNEQQPKQNPQQPKRNPFFSFLPYLLIIAAVAGLIALFTRNLWNRVTVWDERIFNTNLRFAMDEDPYKGEGEVYIRNASVSTNEQSTSITGTAVKKSNDAYNFTVTIDNAQYRDDFYVGTKEELGNLYVADYKEIIAGNVKV